MEGRKGFVQQLLRREAPVGLRPRAAATVLTTIECGGSALDGGVCAGTLRQGRQGAMKAMALQTPAPVVGRPAKIRLTTLGR